MLDTSPEAMWDELEASRRQMEDKLFARDEMIGRYHGPFFDRSSKFGGKEPENPAFEWIATISAQIIDGDPRCSTRALRADKPITRVKAEALRYSLNRLARDGDDARRFRELFVDWCFGPAFTCIYRKPYPWSDRGPLDGPVHRPDMARISPPWMRYDSRARGWGATRWRGHGTLTSKQALLRSAGEGEGWRVGEINDLDTEFDLGKDLPKESQGLKGRDDFRMWHVWVPEEQLEEDYGYENGFWGTTHFYAQTKHRRGSKAPLVEIRDPQPYFGCRSGPYIMSGQHYVPDHVHTLSIMVAIESIARALRLQSAVIDDAMKSFKRFVIEGSGTQNLGMLIKNARHGGVIKAKGFNRNMASEYTVGGLDTVMQAMYQFRIEQMDRRSGLTDSMKGQVRPGATATAETIAQGGANARLSGLRNEFYSFVRDNFRARGEMIDGDDTYLIPTPPELMQQVGQPYIQGGREPGESFEDYEIEIEPLSMRHRSEAEREVAAARELELFSQVAAVAPTAPFIDWHGVVSDQAEPSGNPELPERFNKQVYAAVAALMLQNAIPPEAAGAAGQVKRTATTTKDTGAGRAALATPSRQLLGSRTPRPRPGARQGVAGNHSGAEAGAEARKKAKPARPAK